MSDGEMMVSSAIPAPIVQAQDPRVVSEQMSAIYACIKQAMREGEDYGAIPGTDGSKKVLLKPGAEKLVVLFGLSVETDVVEREFPGMHREYRTTVRLVHRASGALVATGVGACSTLESKYRWRKGERICPECGVAAIIKGKEEYGGGWLCWTKKGGCGAKWSDGAEEIESQSVDRVENEDPADLWNTALKIAKKRGLIDAVLTGTAASAMFTQDLEDDPSPREAPPRGEPVKPVPRLGFAGAGKVRRMLTTAGLTMADLVAAVTAVSDGPVQSDPAVWPAAWLPRIERWIERQVAIRDAKHPGGEDDTESDPPASAAPKNSGETRPPKDRGMR